MLLRSIPVLHFSSFPGDGVPGGVANLYVDDTSAAMTSFSRSLVTVTPSWL